MEVVVWKMNLTAAQECFNAVIVFTCFWNSRRRVKLYALNAERQWDDKGTGHVTSTYVERLKGMSLLVRAESDGKKMFSYAVYFLSSLCLSPFFHFQGHFCSSPKFKPRLLTKSSKRPSLFGAKGIILTLHCLSKKKRDVMKFGKKFARLERWS